MRDAGSESERERKQERERERERDAEKDEGEYNRSVCIERVNANCGGSVLCELFFFLIFPI